MDVENILKSCLELIHVELSESQRDAVLKELKAWLLPSVKGEGQTSTRDGSFTLIHPTYGEPYHSITAGAIRECLEKFLYPSELLERAKELKVVRILDVGFGLGYNLAVAIKELRDLNPRLEFELVSLEKELPKKVPEPPEEFGFYHKLLWKNLPQFEKEGIRFKLLIGDARYRIKEVEGFKAHAVFHDGFSPYKNPELWSLDFLRHIRRLMDEEGVWLSYTSSLPVRKALRELGFYLESTKSIGRKRGGTKASLRGEDRLSPEESLKLQTSPYALPFLDPELHREPLEILVDYRVRVELQKVAQGGIEPPTPRFSAVCSTN